MKKALQFLKIAFSVALILYLGRKVSFADAAEHLLHLHPVLALTAFVILGVSLSLSGLRWYYAAGSTIPLATCQRFTWVSQLYAIILPSTFSADVVKGVIMTAQKKSDSGRSLSVSIVLDRLAGLGSLIVFGLLSCLARPDLLPVSPHAILSLASLGTIGLLILPWILRRFLPSYRIEPRDWFMVLGISAVIYAVNITFYCVSLAAVGGSESWWQMGIYTCLLNLAMLLPISIGGIGLREQIAVSLFQSSANAPVQIAFGWLVLFLSIVHGLIGLALHWQRAEPSKELVSAGDIG
jgi:glycosyltransferase 2 family protein